jgi:ankyrin repeat protein
MSLKKDKQKGLGEHFDDARIKTFLDYEAYGDINPDFHRLERAYRGMIAENFATFVQFFVEAGFDINAKSQEGLSFLQTIKNHRQADDYITALVTHGAE